VFFELLRRAGHHQRSHSLFWVKRGNKCVVSRKTEDHKFYTKVEDENQRMGSLFPDFQAEKSSATILRVFREEEIVIWLCCIVFGKNKT
jgi:hypothetical protein